MTENDTAQTRQVMIMLMRDRETFHTLGKLPARFYKSIDEFVSRLLEAEEESLSNVILFGSCASGTVKTNSDVDICVVSELPIEDRFERIRIRQMADRLPCDFDIVFYTVDDMQNGDTFTKNLRRGLPLLTEVV